MKLVFIFGMPASGKVTVSRELVGLTGFKLFHNHLVVDLLLTTFEFGSEPFVQLREEIWLSDFAQACRSGLGGLIFTFAPESTVRPAFVDETIKIVTDAGGEVDFVELACPIEELKRRIDSPSRREFGKLTSADMFDQLHTGGIFDWAHMPDPRVTIDTSLHTPAEAAVLITKTLGLQK
jgi:hypothetical protein